MRGLVWRWALAMGLCAAIAIGYTTHRETFVEMQDASDPNDVRPSNAEDASGAEVAGSMPQNHKIRYPNAYYYEMDNACYEGALRKALASCDPMSPDLEKGWGKTMHGYELEQSPLPTRVEQSTRVMLKDLEFRINREEALFLTTDDALPERPKIRVVQFRMRSYRLHRFGTKVQAEVVLYREGKYQGKHVLLTAVIPEKGQIVYPTIVLLGVVSSDQVGLSPVQFRDPEAPGFVPADHREDAWKPSKKEVLQVMASHLDTQKRFIETSYAIASG